MQLQYEHYKIIKVDIMLDIFMDIGYNETARCKMKEYLLRLIERTIADKLETKGCVAIEGPKWCGKSTTAKLFAKTVIELQRERVFTQYKALAALDEKNLLRGGKPLMFDEWQKIPSLWDAIRCDVDETRERGQYILTGSCKPIEDKERHSGTGRIVKIVMRTMSLWESKDSTGEVSLKSLFDEKPDNIYGKNDINLDRLAFLICRGGWPDIIFDREKLALDASLDYVESLITEDITKVDDVKRDPERARAILRSYARLISSPAPLTKVQSDVEANDMTIDKRTVDSYISAFEKLYVIEDVPCWSPKLRSQTAIRTTNIRQFVDPSVATAISGSTPNDLIADLNTMGLVFESLCVRDLRIYAQTLGGKVYQYHDADGLEVDVIVHVSDGKWGAIEIKLGSPDAIEDGAKHLLAFRDKIDSSKQSKPAFLAVVTGTQLAYRRPDGVYVVPIGCLKD
ncbi:ATPase AAA [Clostridia bacterium]|nr:ATPase AAA [Clostridia bacterium]